MKIGFAIAAVIITLGVFFAHVDYFPKIHTYGVSAGTVNDYCSVELVGSALVISCQ